MPDTLTLIQKITVGAAGASSITFTNIPQTYTDLKIVASVRSNRAGAINSFMRLYPNGNTTGITYRALFGTGSAASSFIESTASQYVGEINATNSTSNTFSNTEIYIPNYTSGAQKSYSVDFVIENNATLAYAGLIAELWANTSAITSIQLLDGLASFVQHSTFYLYGVTKFGSSTPGSAAAYATGGDDITTDGTYWIHTFRSSGTFTPKKALSNVDYLVVAGGGGALGDRAGGGGAGGLRCTVGATGGGGTLESALSLTAQAYTVTIGAGGTSRANGSNSIFSTITSTGGGAGGYTTQAGSNGGSGGGGGGQGTPAGGTRTTNQGYAGGTGAELGAAGGGGAGAVGSNGSTASSGTGGNGGSGVTTSISGTSTTYAGGGGGYGNGVKGTGTAGGGDGSIGSTGAVSTSGTANTGGGAGGGHGSMSTNGGSGIVIVRYPV